MKTLKQWDSVVYLYNSNMGEEGDTFNKDLIEPTVLDLTGNLSDKIVLDSGCGSGYFSAKISAKAKKVIGSDFSLKFVNLCRKKYQKIKNLEFIQHDIINKMPFDDNFFDLIISKMVLQYVPKLNIFAAESYRILKSRGILIVAVDHPFNTQFYYAQQVVGKPNPRYGILNDYFDHKEHTKLSLWNKVNLTWYPKTVSDYILPFIKTGLNLADIHEIPEEKKGIRIPRVLALKFRKN